MTRGGDVRVRDGPQVADAAAAAAAADEVADEQREFDRWLRRVRRSPPNSNERGAQDGDGGVHREAGGALRASSECVDNGSEDGAPMLFSLSSEQVLASLSQNQTTPRYLSKRRRMSAGGSGSGGSAGKEPRRRSVSRGRAVDDGDDDNDEDDNDEDELLSQDWRAIATACASANAQQRREARGAESPSSLLSASRSPYVSEDVLLYNAPEGGSAAAAADADTDTDASRKHPRRSGKRRSRRNLPARLRSILDPEEQANLGRAFRERFPEPPSATNAEARIEQASAGAVALSAAQRDQLWRVTLKPESDLWYAQWHEFMAFARRTVRNDASVDWVGYALARKWVRRYLDTECTRRPAPASSPSSRRDGESERGQRRLRRRRRRQQRDSDRWLSISDEERAEEERRRASISDSDKDDASDNSDDEEARRRWHRLAQFVASLDHGWWGRDIYAPGDPVWVGGLPGQGRRLWPARVAVSASALCSRKELAHFSTRDDQVLVDLGERSTRDDFNGRYAWKSLASVQPLHVYDKDDAVLERELGARRAGSRARERLELAIAEVYDAVTSTAAAAAAEENGRGCRRGT